MAIIQVNFMSKSLMRTVPINVILPVDKLSFPGMPEPEFKPFKTLYLLHGVFGSYIDWVNGTAIQRWAEEKNLAVVMPSGDNAFYTDQTCCNNMYGEYVGKELVEITRKMFPLSTKREDTFIGGLSMGGYGALRNGMKYNETFGAIVGLSSAMILYDANERTNDEPFFIGRRDYVEQCFGDLSKVLENDINPVWSAKQIAANGGPMPKVFMACGSSDSLLPANLRLRDELKEAGVDVTWVEAPGAHEWDFWNTHIKEAVDWLPLDDGLAGVNSGNVGV